MIRLNLFASGTRVGSMYWETAYDRIAETGG